MILAPGNIVGNAGGPYKTLDGAMNIHAADVHQIPANDFIHRHGVATTLVAAASAGDVQIEVADTTGFIVGNYVHMGETPTTQEPIHPSITDVDGTLDIITLDMPLTFGYANGDAVSLAVVNMAPGTALASLVAPISFKYYAHVGRVEHIKRILISMQHTSAADDSTFGDLPALTNGCVLRAFVNGNMGTFTNWKSNGDIILDMYDVDYHVKSGGGLFGTTGRGSFSRLDLAIELDSARGDYLELLVQDDLTDLVNFRIKAQGHVEGG